MQTLIVVFIVVWVGVALIWIALDWLGSAERGRFKPAGFEIPWRPSRARQSRRRRKAHEAELVREELEYAYGRPTLRFRSNISRSNGDSAELDEFDELDEVEFDEYDDDDEYDDNDQYDDEYDNDDDNDDSGDPDQFAAEFSPTEPATEPDTMQRARTLWKQMSERDR